MVSKYFDLKSNPTNMAISSPLNAYVNYCIEASCRITPQSKFKIGIGMTHISNGNFRQPNKGLNFLTASAGYVYNLGKSLNTNGIHSSIVKDTTNHQLLVMGLYGQKQISRRYNWSYAVKGIAGEYSRRIAGNSWLGASVSFYYDPSLVKELELSDTLQYYKK
ncbi:MAG: acyloxyacyl hydrolase [Chloroflexia bacterium]|nr:acyloxyacyl hydrolase [Chloroflexia bacterium]